MTKKPSALAEYAALMGRVAEWCAYNRKCEAAEHAALYDALHGGGKPTQEELIKAKGELEQTDDPLDDYCINRRVVRNRAEASKPSAPTPDVLQVGLSLSAAEELGGDPFPNEWQKLHDELIYSDLPERVYNEIENRHKEFVALFPCANGIPDDVINGYAAFLLGLCKQPNGKPIAYQGGISQDEFATACGVTTRTVKNWDAKKTTPPTVYHTQRKEHITYSPKLRRDILLARSFAMYYKMERDSRRALKKV